MSKTRKEIKSSIDDAPEIIEIERKTLGNKVDKHSVIAGQNSAKKSDVEDTEPL